VKFTGIETFAALKALFLLDHIGRPFFVASLNLGNAACRAFFRTGAAADALFLIDYKAQQFFALPRTALLVMDMLEVFIAEIFDGGYGRVGRSLTQSAE
jgi:hypothetical protein